MRNQNKPVAAMATISLLAALPAQDEPTPAQRTVAMKQQAADLLTGFARKAAVNRQHSQARRAYQMVLDHYDADSVAAHKGLGHRKVKGEWRPGKGKRRKDDQNPRKQQSIRRAWREASEKIGELHGALGLELVEAGELAAGHSELERALEFQPSESRWHLGLGHVEAEGFWGTEEQVAVVRRMHEIRDRVDELRSTDYEVTRLDAARMPASLRRAGLPFIGGKSKHYTIWIIGDPAQLEAMLCWAERCHDLLTFLLGRNRSALRPNAHRFFAAVVTQQERDQVWQASPEVLRGHTPAQAGTWDAMWFRSGGGFATFSWGAISDREQAIVAHVVKRHLVLSRNTALGEGLQHLCTYLLQGTTSYYFTSLPHTLTSGYQRIPRKPGLWTTRLEEQVAQGRDWPLAQLPRERSDNFRDEARIKAWNFIGWLVARYPNRWFKLLDGMGAPKELTVELVEQRYQELLGASAADLQAEWREWAKAGSQQREASAF